MPTQKNSYQPFSRLRDSFDFGWKFYQSEAPGAQQPEYDDAAWQDLDLPHDWSITGPFREEPRLTYLRSSSTNLAVKSNLSNRALSSPPEASTSSSKRYP